MLASGTGETKLVASIWKGALLCCQLTMKVDDLTQSTTVGQDCCLRETGVGQVQAPNKRHSGLVGTADTPLNTQ